MNIIYLHQYFKTPDDGGGTRSFWIANKLSSGGHNITILTSSNNFKKNVHVEIENNIKIVYFKISYSNNLNFTKRIFAFIKYSFLSTIYILNEKKIDLIFASSTPLTVTIPTLIGYYIKKIPYIFEIRDLWPEAPIELGILKNKILIKLSFALVKLTYLNAKYLIALSSGMAIGINKILDCNYKMHIIPNMSKPDIFSNKYNNNNIHLNNLKYKLIYFGTLGYANNIEFIINLAISFKMRKLNDFQIIIIGNGKMLNYLLESIKTNDLENILYLGYKNYRDTAIILQQCQFSLVTFLNKPILDTNSPNKLFDSISAKKPVIVNSNGWTKDLVLYNRIGIHVNSVDDCIDKLVQIKNNPILYEELSINSYNLAINHFNKDLLTQKILNLVNSLQTDNGK